MLNRFQLAVATCSCAVLLTEVTLTRIFSVTLMYHYSFLVLSITLFGLGAGGTFHFLSDICRRREGAPAFLALAAGASLPLSLGIILRLPFSPQVLTAGNVGALVLIVLLAALPFFLCGLFLSLVYIVNRENVSRLYASDLLGAAIGCLSAVSLISVIGAPHLPLVASGLLMASGVLAAKHKNSAGFRAGVIAILAGLVVLPWTPWLSLNMVKGELERNIEFQKWNAFSRVAVSDFDTRKVIHIDADAATEMVSPAWPEQSLEDLAGITRLAYEIRKNSTALVVGPGGGRELAAALTSGHTVTGVEINPIIVSDIMLGSYRTHSGSVYAHPKARIFTGDARSYLERTQEKFGVIQANAVDTWAAVSGGGFTLSESYLYTVEAFAAYLRHLEDDGVLTLGRWVLRPPQQMLRIVALALEAMEIECPGDYRGRFFLVSDPSYEQGGGVPGVVLIKKIPFTATELETLHDAAAKSRYTVLYSPAIDVSNPYSELIHSSDRNAFFQTYPLNVRASSDDLPFFFFTLRWKDLLTVWNTAPESRKNNAGLFILISAFLMMSALTVVTFVLPLVIKGRQRIRFSAGGFFLSIGLAFMMIETVLIQKTTLFLGHPTVSFVTVLCGLLIGAGLGSASTRNARGYGLRGATVMVLVAGVAVVLVLSWWLALAFHWPLAARILWIAVPLIGMGVLLGRLFPMAMARLTEREIAWAWALNGSGSVLGSLVAVLIAMQFGFLAVLWVALAFYGFAAAAGSALE